MAVNFEWWILDAKDLIILDVNSIPLLVPEEKGHKQGQNRQTSE